MRSVLLAGLVLILSSCASKELAVRGKAIENSSDINMLVTTEVLNDYSDRYNLLLQINFESKDGNWVRVDEAEVFFDKDISIPVNIIVGKDLVTWAEAKAEEKKIADFNKSMGIAGVDLLGGALAVTGILAQSKELVAAGSLTMAGAGVYRVASDVKSDIAKHQGVLLVPEGHLYTPFVVPSMSFVKKWVLINSPSGKVGQIVKIKIKTVEGETLTYHLDLMGKS